MNIKYFAALAVLVLTCTSVESQVKIGQPLPNWKKGELDIHFINTARGEATYQILPDGTTLLVDASGSLMKFGVSHSDPLPSKPSSHISPGKVIIDYISHFSPKSSKGHVDYFLLTHFHSDHMGKYTDELPYGPDSLFRLASIEEIGTGLVLDRIMDRCYPDYTLPTRSYFNSKMMKNYWAFMDWTQKENKSKVERFDVGSDSQIVPVHGGHYKVKVRNYSGNGRFWDGKDGSYTLMPSSDEFEKGPKEAIPGENCFSCSYILTYGKFDFFLGGDLQYNDRDKYPYMDAESPVGKVAHKVEVMKADHHGTKSTNCHELMSVLQPDVWVVSNWRSVQPNPATVDCVLEESPNCDIFCTNMSKKNIPVLGERMNSIDEYGGHVVVRVSKRGRSYMIYILDDSDQKYVVKSIYGPYKCSK